MRPAGFETAFSASERPQTHDLDRAFTGIEVSIVGHVIFMDKMGKVNDILLAEPKREGKINKDVGVKDFDNTVTLVNTDCNRCFEVS
jgi:hypothetical protein